ncbi:acyl-CoA dehydrogenase family protein [Salmonella enterica subsp. enterica serovar Paratyphi A]
MVLTEASIIMEEINRSGGNSGACHGQMYNMNTLLRHGSDKQKEFWLPRIATGEWRLQSMGVTEPTAGTDTTRIKTTAIKREDRYVINGQKVWIFQRGSNIQTWNDSSGSKLLPLANVKRKSEGMSIFMVDIKEAMKNGMTVRPIPNMVNHETNELFLTTWKFPKKILLVKRVWVFITYLRFKCRAYLDCGRMYRRWILVYGSCYPLYLRA